MILDLELIQAVMYGMYNWQENNRVKFDIDLQDRVI
jgi:hypothetical protein